MSALIARAMPHVVLGVLCAGIAAANLVRPTSLLLAAPAAVLLAFAAMAGGTTRVVSLATAAALAGCWWGAERLEALDRSPLREYAGRSARATVVVTGPARSSPFELRLPAEVRRFGSRAMREPVLLKLPLPRSPPQGAVLELIGEVELPRGPEQGFDERAYLARRGVHVVLRASTWRVTGRRGGLAGFADRLRARIARTMAPSLEGERRAVVAGIVLGEDEGLSDELSDAFRASGLYHLLAVSGSNVALVGGGVVGLLLLAGLRLWLCHLAGIAAIAGYLMAVGWQPSVVRAGVAGVLASLAWLAARPRDRWYFLLLGAAVLLAWNPGTLLEPGFQLSFGAVAAIFVGVPRLRSLLDGYPVPARVADAAAVSAACGLATAPLLLWHFEAVPVYSMVSNVAAFPAVAPLLGLALATVAIEPVSPSLASTLAWVEGWLAAYLAGVARFVAGLPYAQLEARAFAALAVFAAALVWAARRRRGRRVAAAVVIVLAGAAFAGWRLMDGNEWPPPPRDGVRITALDVGQGDATLLQVPEGAVLVDQGPPEARVADQLKRLGIRHLAMLVMTHPSRDNIGGAETVVRDVDVGLVVDPALPFENPFGASALAEARHRGIRVAVARAGREFRLGRLRLRVLWPDGRAPPGVDPNDHATVLLASFGELDALLPADAESNVTLPLHLPRVEILKVAHHGSADRGLGQLLELLEPRVAVVSAGAGNEYGHPAPSTTTTLEARDGLTLYRTDRDGRVSLDSDGTRLWVHTERE